MKLIYFANIRFPTERAHGVNIAKMCEAFADSGVTVQLVIPNRATKISDDPYAYYGIKHNFEIIKPGKVENLNSYFGYLVSYVMFAVRLLFFCFKNKADIYYSRDESLVLVLSFFGSKVVWEAHGWKDNLIIRRFISRIRGIIAITSLSKKRFISNGLPENRILVAPDGIDETVINSNIEKTLARQWLGLPVEGKYVFYIGLLDEWKGYKALLNSANKLADANIKVVIIGGSDDQIKKLKMEFSSVIFLGYIPYKNIAIMQAAADVLVIPNSSKFVTSTEYTSPLKLFAHMASGIPILCSNLPSIREILDDEKAFFFTPDDHVSLTKQIKYVLANHDEADSRARHAKIDVLKYTWRNRARNILSFISIPSL